MQFGITLKPEHSIERTIALTRQAEAAGFEYAWLFDSHVLWRDPYPLLTLMARETTRIRLGTCVTNPATREPSVTASLLAELNEVSDGRMDLGIGRGDSARRVLGKPPTSMKDLEEAVHVIRELVEGRAVEYEGTELRLTWSRGDKLPVWIAGYGPVALKLTGRIADGSMLQIGDPGPKNIFAWAVYTRGSMTLQALRHRVGESAFWTILQTWVADREGGNGTTEDFQALAEQVSGEDLDGFFTAWLVSGERPAHTAENGF